MLKAYFQNDEIVTEGEIYEGEFYQNFCCAGFEWEVRWIYHDTDPRYNSIWGHCENPVCPCFQKDIGPLDPYRGVRNISQEDFEEWLAEQTCQPTTSYPGAEFAAEMADDEARYPVPHVHTWVILGDGYSAYAVCNQEAGTCLKILDAAQIEAILNQYAQDYGLSAVQLAAPAVLETERVREYFEKRQ